MSRSPVRIIWVLVVIVLLVGVVRVLSLRGRPSPDRKILIEKEKQ